MGIPIIGVVVELGKLVAKGVIDHFRRKQELKEAVHKNRVRLALTQGQYDHEWEMKSLENAGWKDDILFYTIVAMYIYSAIDPDGAMKVFKNWEMIPEWFRTITFWVIASVIGVKKLGDYLPSAIAGIKQAIKAVADEKKDNFDVS